MKDKIFLVGGNKSYSVFLIRNPNPEKTNLELIQESVRVAYVYSSSKVEGHYSILGVQLSGRSPELIDILGIEHEESHLIFKVHECAQNFGKELAQGLREFIDLSNVRSKE